MSRAVDWFLGDPAWWVYAYLVEELRMFVQNSSPMKKFVNFGVMYKKKCLEILDLHSPPK